jgi:transposase
MEAAVTIGLDLGKSVFQVHGVDIKGTVVVQRRIMRARLLAFLRKAAGLPGWNGGLRSRSSLGSGAAEARAPGEVDAATLCQTVCEAAEERRGGCRGDLRGGYPSEHALR